jgi:diguanylate cyclase (GGDEF)-like protein/PAS domain S-box-containing protein
MEKLKNTSPWVILLAYVILVGGLSLLLVFVVKQEQWMILLAAPIFLIGTVHPKRLYLAMILINVTAAIWVILQLSQNYYQSFITLSAITIFILGMIEALREMYRRWSQAEQLLFSMEDLLFVFRPAGQILDVNQSVIMRLGYSKQEIIGRSFWSLYTQDEQRDVRAASENIRTGKPRIYRSPLQTKDGNFVAVDTAISRGVWNGQPALLAICRDISIRRRAEEALQLSELRFRSIAEQSYDGIVLVDEKGVIIEWNRAQERITGLRMEDVIGKQMPDILQKLVPEDPLDPARYDRMLESIAFYQKSGQVPIGERLSEHNFQGPDGSIRKVQILVNPVSTNKGMLLSMIMRDITEQIQMVEALRESERRYRQLYEALRESEERYRAFVENFQGIAWRAALDMTPIFIHGALEEISGYTEAELLSGHPGWNDLVYSDDLTRVLSERNRVFTIPGDTIELEYRIVRKDGQIRWVQELVRNVVGTDENPVWVQGAVYDITPRKQVEQELQQANSRLSQSLMETEEHNQEIVLLQEMGDLFQTCQTTEETCQVFEQYIVQIFPESSGALYFFQKNVSFLEAVSTWGDPPVQELLINKEDCWGLRRGRVHRVISTETMLPCPHFNAHDGQVSLCVPMLANNETMGILHLRFFSQDCSQDDGLTTWVEAKEQLAIMVTYQMAMAMVNLNLRQMIQQHAIRDALTGLFNRYYLQETLQRELVRAQRRQSSFGIILVDVDHLKEINLTQGYDVGDQVLKVVATYLATHVRGSDVTCRYGDDEFMVALFDASLDIAYARALQFNQDINQLVLEIQGRPIGPLSTSIGVAAFPTHGIMIDHVVQAATSALYRAKENGNGGVLTP